ncbi:MAG TPA: alpha/beta fold hydrolase, partial [bacterium]|nr:alpha/beta fold hydrolase [bacterium]
SGGFGTVQRPIDDWRIAAWVLNGGVYVQAGVRGGGEYGPQWHEAGSGRNKGTAVRDFLSCARTLIDGGYTRPERMGYLGFSQGGWLVTAAALKDPSLVAGVVAMAPVTDLLIEESPWRYPQDPETAKRYALEFGPLQTPEDVEFRRGLSPYELAADATNPQAMLIACASDDDNVDTVHAHKLVARLQGRPHDRPVLLLQEPVGGHQFTDNNLDRHTLYARVFGFLWHELGMDEGTP